MEKCIQYINERTFLPFRIIVIDNNSQDGSQGMLKEMKVQGKIFDVIFMPENVGQCRALSKGFDVVEEWENNKERMHRPSNDFIVTSQEDCFPPMLGQNNCWLKQMIEILEKNEPEYGGLCQRIQRMPRTDIDESKEIIPGYKNFPSVFRLMRRSDLRKIEGNKFGTLRKWESNVTGENYKNIIRKKFGFTTHIFSDHAGFMLERKGFPDGVDTFTVADNKLNERFDKPYPDIDPLTNVPIKINHKCDAAEQAKRDEYYKLQDKINK
ncbi:MAG: glycosyltransferase [Spirochaetes bacterium]|nr:glycosyltransferase [Spirochaetota bacterium]